MNILKPLIVIFIRPFIWLYNLLFKRRGNNLVEFRFNYARAVQCQIEMIKNQYSFSDDFVLIATYIMFLARYFYICDDRQVEPMKKELYRLFKSNFNLETENFYEYNGKIYEIIFQTMTKDERDALVHLFSFTPPLWLNDKTIEGKPLARYSFVVFLNIGELSSNFYMSVGPDKILLPLAITLFLEFVLKNLKNPRNTEILADLSLRLLESYNTTNCRSMTSLIKTPRNLLARISPNL